jgi:carbamoyl-phosphate synthase large subunit
VEKIGLPCVIRPSFTMGGIRFRHRLQPARVRAISSTAASIISPTSEVLIEESMIGWKEYEMEVMRDVERQRRDHLRDRKLRPDGRAHRRLHHGRAGQTLTDKEYQRMRDASLATSSARSASRRAARIFNLRSIPTNGRMIVIEMNPRVSRSSALASKATGFPIAKIAAKLAVGYTLHELPNDITARDEGVLRAVDRLRRDEDPRELPFEKFPDADDDAHDADEIGRRSDGHRPHVQRSRSKRRCAGWSWT